jgi:hypothetical protein
MRLLCVLIDGQQVPQFAQAGFDLVEDLGELAYWQRIRPWLHDHL